LIAVSPT